MSGYSELIKKYLPQVEWLPEGEKFLVDRITPVYWHSPEDFFKFVNARFGGMFEFGDFLRGYIDEKDLTQAELKLRMQREKMQRNIDIRKKEKTQKEYSELYGISERQVRNIQKPEVNEAYADKVSGSDKPKVIQYKINSGTKPQTAAQKIREKFGDAFADELKSLL